MVSLVKKVLTNPMDRKLFGAMIVIAGSCSLPFEHANIGAMHVHTYIHTYIANAGGAWTPIGDVTTTMLWINGQISALPTMSGTLALSSTHT